MIKMIIADDHSLIREGFKKILDTEPDIKLVAEASNVEQLLNLVRLHDPDIVSLDIDMPGKNGLEAIKEIKQISPSIKVLVLSIHPEDRYAVRALKLGALAYLTKESAPDELVKAIRKIVTGRQYISERLGEQLVNNIINPSIDKPHESLSEREFSVLLLIASGNSNSQIADELFISTSTVNTYRSRLLEKLNCKSNAALVHYCIKNGLVTN